VNPPKPEIPRVATRDEWLAARTALLAREKELTRASDALAAARRQLPMVRVERSYRFDGPDGPVTLEELFEGRRQLIVYHFMWHADRDEGCPGCSLLLDTIGDPVHLNAANTTLAVVSRGPLDRLQAYWRRMGWTLPVYSSARTDFNFDFQATIDVARGATDYNFRDIRRDASWGGYEGDLPGASVFLRDGGGIYHTYSTYARGGESLMTLWSILDLTPLGRQEEAGVQSWVRHHDRYQHAAAPACCAAHA